MQLDRYGESTIMSLYYDTATDDLIRTSIDRPFYKEKLRVRSYGVPGENDTVYIELKKKLDGVVYKRREGMALRDTRRYLEGRWKPDGESQILREVDYFLDFYKPVPKMMISCERKAYFERFGPPLRLTIDRDIRHRETELDLAKGADGKLLFEEPFYILEVKVPGAFPLWLTHVLTDLGLFIQPFSKYGISYKFNMSGGFYEYF